jgi:hypothetical protein
VVEVGSVVDVDDVVVLGGVVVDVLEDVVVVDVDVTVVGAIVVGAIVVGATVVGATVVVGTTLRVAIAVASETFDCEPMPS